MSRRTYSRSLTRQRPVTAGRSRKAAMSRIDAARGVARDRARGVTYARTASYALASGETKYFDTGINIGVTSGSADWTNSEVACDNAVNGSGTAAAYTDSALIPSAVGSAYGQINGNRYHLKKLRVRGIINAAVLQDQGDMPGARPFRLMLVLDTMPSGAQAQGEDIMQDVGANETLYSFKRMADLGSRFRILKDLTSYLDPKVAGTDGANTNSVSFESREFSFQYAPSSPMSVQIKSGNAVPTIAGLVTANIFLLLHTAGNPLTITASARAYYTD